MILPGVARMTKPITSASSSRFLAGLYVAELCAIVAALTLQRRGDRPWLTFLTGPAGWVCVVAFAALLASLLGLAYLVRGVAPPRGRRLAVPLVVNLVSLGLVSGVAEAVVRVLATPTIQGPVVMGTVLLPHRWEEVAARSRALLDDASVARSYLVSDPELGWTIGPSRQSVDYNRQGVEEYLARLGAPAARRPPPAADAAIYVSSVEGMRSPRPGVSFAAMPAKRRIALVGDSFTFGLEVYYEDTWASQLERVLGPEFQVLNFGVDGFGVDQAYLRYRRDVAAWHPEIAVLGVIDDDFRRTMCVYAFLCFPGFGMPFAKPRLVLDPQGLTPLNLPLAPPRALFDTGAITELPYLAFDGSFDPVEWESRFYDHAYAIRLVLSRYRPWSTARPAVSPPAQRALNVEIVRAFIRLARARGAVPIVVYFPSRPHPGSALGAPSVAREAFAASHVRYLDLTDCVGAVPPAQRFMALHYSPRTNIAVARCLQEAIATGFHSS
jgi:hypothetical protein